MPFENFYFSYIQRTLSTGFSKNYIYYNAVFEKSKFDQKIQRNWRSFIF